MDILKAATDWAKAEVYSATFLLFFGIAFLLFSIGSWQLGTTTLSSAYILPTALAGILVLAVGVGIFVANKARITSFVTAYNSNPREFVQSEMVRTEKSLKEYKNIVFRIIPLIIAVAALLIYYMDHPIWRASCITIVAMMLVILLVDSMANARLETYHEQLKQEE